METIRININKQLNRDGMLPVIAYPTDAAYDFRVRSCKTDMDNLSTDSAYRISIYPDGTNMQTSLVKGITDGFIEFSILVDISRATIDGKLLLGALQDLAAAYNSLAANDSKPNENERFKSVVADIHKGLTESTQPGYPLPIPVAKDNKGEELTFYMNYKTEGEIHTLIRYPDQEFFSLSPFIYLVGDNVHPTRPQACKHIHSLVLRTFKIKSPQGYEYGQVKEGDTTRISLKGKEGMLPMTTDVRGDVAKPSPYGYYDTATSTIRIDERKIKFYYELKFMTSLHGRRLLNSTVRYNGEQLMPDANGCYLIKVYEEDVNDAGVIRFSGEGFKDAEIQVTPGIVKSQEYLFTPQPLHDVTQVTLDFNDGRPITTLIDIGTNERLFQQLQAGKVKGYRVKQEGDSFRMFVPRKLTASSKNTLRLLKFLAMVLFTLAAYGIAEWLSTGELPWPLSKNETKPITTTTVGTFNDNGEISQMEEEEEDVGLVVDETDKVALESHDYAYLQANDVWRKDSIKSSKYMDVLNTIYNGRLSEIKMKGYNTKVINNAWWSLIWTNIIVPNNIHKKDAKEVFDLMTADHNSLDVHQLYEELNKRLLPVGDAVQSTPRPQSAPRPQQAQQPVVPSSVPQQ